MTTHGMTTDDALIETEIETETETETETGRETETGAGGEHIKWQHTMPRQRQGQRQHKRTAHDMTKN
jgi:hypothetical protein